MEYVDANKLMESLKDIDWEAIHNIPVTYSKEFWDNIAKSIKKENEDYERQCRSMQIDPISGKSTMSWEDRNKPFTL